MAPETFSGKIYIVKIVLYKMMREGYIWHPHQNIFDEIIKEAKKLRFNTISLQATLSI